MTDLPILIGRPFRLHLTHRVFDGWELADGQALALEDPELGLTASASTLDDLVRGYGGGHVEWLPQPVLAPARP
ncbi:hypothetical protein [Streptomyces prunicolor]|uniref:hypothetical protein n=1 Tax=Streptomyces prunicolor TaxID=67348 RepID=UPI0033C26446